MGGRKVEERKEEKRKLKNVEEEGKCNERELSKLMF
jgi:hypothetical protein